jgi:glutathione synthase/RimK-type ligase-like ATP-grasp enzyme
MRFLITSSRIPTAIDEIRKLGQRGHTVVASDTISTAAGSHSRHAARSKVTASPQRQTRRFIDDVARILREERIDVVLPAFEEVFYLARHADELAPHAKLFFPPFETLATLHDKAKMRALAERIGVRVPRSLLAESEDDLRRAITVFPEYFARPLYSRGGVELVTNTGPLAGVVEIERCTVSKEKPWIVQEFIHGRDTCTFSVVHHGKITGHAAYVHPREIEHAGGIVFESVDEPECLEIARKIIEETRYHGQVSFDFLRAERGMVLIECNPRPTAGAHLMTPEMLEGALLDEAGSECRIAPAGVQCKYSIALLRDMLLHLREIPEDARHLFSRAKEMFADPDDLLPALYQILSYANVLKFRLRAHVHGKRSLMAAIFEDICWDGEPIE